MSKNIFFNEHGKLYTELNFLENGDTTVDYTLIPCSFLSSVLERDPSNGVLELLVSLYGGAGKLRVQWIHIKNDSELFLAQDETLVYKFMNDDYNQLIDILQDYNYDKDRSQYLMTQIERKK